ncbi:phosphorylase [Crenobacter oryzisoli]|uniref:phosphorylase n=1 Tax=Crenobacter oryzisoli TaxID=3056844 RepID=UPI00338DD737
MAFEARTASATGAEVLFGMRASALERALAVRLSSPCAGVISFGVAGGLDAALVPGTVVVAKRIVDGEHGFDTDPAWSAALRAALPQAVYGAVAGRDAAVVDVADKRILHRTSSALTVDMESHIAARVAQAAGVPYTACRVVIDPAWRSVPSAALAGMGSDGHTDIVALLRDLGEQPRQLAGLLQLARDAFTARSALHAARRALGERFAMP